MADSIFYALFWTIIIWVWLRYSRLFRKEELGTFFPTGFLVKALAGFLFVIVYTRYYGANDAFGYLRDSKILHETFFKSPAAYLKFFTGIGTSEQLVSTYLIETKLWSRGTTNLVNDSQNIIRINSIICFFSYGNPYVHAVFMSLFSAIGLRELTLAFKTKINVNPKIIFAVLVLLPNVWFWSSGILKEPILILGIGIAVRGLIGSETGWKKWGRIVAGLIILAGIKPYVLICILIALTFYGISLLIFKNRPIWGLLVFGTLSVCFLLVTPRLRNKVTVNLSEKQLASFNVAKGGLYAARNTELHYYFKNKDLHKLKVKDSVVELLEPVDAEENWINIAGDFEPVHLEPKDEKWKLFMALDSSKSLIKTTFINNSFEQLVKNIPEALINSVVRPFPWDPGSLMTYPAVLEVLLCIGFLIVAIWNRRKLNVSEQRLLISLLIFTVILMLLVGWTTPVLGAIVRYRIPAYMAIFIISMFIIKIDFVERFIIPKKWKKTTP